MNSQGQRKKGVMFAAMTDLFMNFALALVWVLFVMPVSGSLSPERSPDPIESKDGERPGSGVRFATVSVSRESDDVTIFYMGEQTSLNDFLELGNSSNFPDHVVFQFTGFPKYEKIAESALQMDTAISLKLRRQTEPK